MKVTGAKKYKDSLYAALSRDLAEFEKNFLLIAAGVLTFSITFIKDIVNIESASLLFSFLGWFTFALSVGLIMFTFIKSAYASDEISMKIDECLQRFDKTEEDDELDKAQTTEIKRDTRSIFLQRKGELKNLRNL